MNIDIAVIAQCFEIPEPTGEATVLSGGLINSTYLVPCGKNNYIIQRINTDVFKNPEKVMENIVSVTHFLRKRLRERDRDPERGTLHFAPAKTGKYWHSDESGFWRACRFIGDARSSFCAQSAEEFALCGKAFGEFQEMLTEFDASTLFESIPDFHNTPKRYEALLNAVKEDKLGRAAAVKPELDFISEHTDFAFAIQYLYEAGKIPLRVTHNDTKLNNVLLDNETGEPICVIDLDTVMPGFCAYDFGDAIRSGACNCAEDEPDYQKATVNLDYFKAFTRGFLEGCGKGLLEDEIRSLPLGAIGITLECGMRFLTDYLEGDTYFKCERENQNLDRCRTQFALAQDLILHLEELNNYVNQYA